MDFNKIENLACYIKMSQNFINSYHSQPTKKNTENRLYEENCPI